jgi:hypothetical protein
MENTTYELGPLLAEIRDGFRGMRAIHASLTAARREDRRAARAARNSLERDLASYTSPGDLNELDAILDRYSDEETADIRRIIAPRRDHGQDRARRVLERPGPPMAGRAGAACRLPSGDRGRRPGRG